MSGEEENDWGEPIFPDSDSVPFGGGLAKGETPPSLPREASARRPEASHPSAPSDGALPPPKLSGRLLSLYEPIPKRFHYEMVNEALEELRSQVGPGVYVHFPTREEGSDQVLIRGPPDPVHALQKGLRRLRAEAEAREDAGDLYVTQTLLIPHHLHSLIIGTGGVVVKNRVSKVVGVVMVDFPRAHERSDTVSVQGRLSRVEPAMTILRQVAAEEARRYDPNFKADASDGQPPGVASTVPADPSPSPSSLSCRSLSAVEPLSQTSEPEAELQVSSGYLKATIRIDSGLLGSGKPLGVEVNRLRRLYPGVQFLCEGRKGQLRLGGQYDECFPAHRALLAFLNGRAKPRSDQPTGPSADSLVELQLPAPRKFFAHIVGTKGSRVKAMETAFPGLNLQLCATIDTIVLGGAAGSVGRVRDSLRSAVRELEPGFVFAPEWDQPVERSMVTQSRGLEAGEGVVSVELAAPTELFGALIGAKGALAKALEHNHPGLRLDFRPAVGRIRASGPRGAVDAAKQSLRQGILHYRPHHTFGPEWDGLNLG